MFYITADRVLSFKNRFTGRPLAFRDIRSIDPDILKISAFVPIAGNRSDTAGIRIDKADPCHFKLTVFNNDTAYPFVQFLRFMSSDNSLIDLAEH